MHQSTALTGTWPAARAARQLAIIWEGDDAAETRHVSYAELQESVCRLANALKAQGVGKGDRVSICLPMIPETAMAMLACARIGAVVHSIIFGGFSIFLVVTKCVFVDKGERHGHHHYTACCLTLAYFLPRPRWRPPRQRRSFSKCAHPMIISGSVIPKKP